MDARFKDIEILVWDIDGTLYKGSKEIVNEILQKNYQIVMDLNSWSREKATAEFHKLYPAKYPSQTTTVSVLCHISVPQAAQAGQDFIRFEKYLKRDKKLIGLFEKLDTYRHFLLVNGTKQNTVKKLRLLGLSASLFEDIISSETVGENKPSEKGFRYILNKTKLPVQTHLMIGDRERVDLEPAKKLGMKTCLAWSATPSQIADITLATIYDLEKILL